MADKAARLEHDWSEQNKTVLLLCLYFTVLQYIFQKHETGMSERTGVR